MIISGVSKVSFEAIKDVECPISLVPIDELEDPVQALPCKHIFDRASILNWLNQNKQNPLCPLDRDKIESLTNVKLVDKAEISANESQEQHPVLPDPHPIQEEDHEKIKALTMLEGSAVVYQVATKNYVDRAKQIQVRHHSKEEEDSFTETAAFRGDPIDQLYAEYWKLPFPLAKNAHAEVSVTKRCRLDGSCYGGGFAILIL